MTVAELGQRMSSRELTEWIAYYQLEPFGSLFEDNMNTLNTSAMVSLFASDKVNHEDFYTIDRSDFAETMTPETLRDKFMAIAKFRPPEPED